MTTTEQSQTNLTAEQTDLILDVTASMVRTGHKVTVNIDEDNITINGDKAAALGRCAVITGTTVEWIF